MNRRSDYHYDLPPERIAQAPADRRDQARLLHVRTATSEHRVFADIVELLPAHAVLVLNDTRVMRARLHGERPSGGQVELLLCAPGASDRIWTCLTRASKPLRPGDIVTVAGTHARIAGMRHENGTLDVEFEESGYALMERAGQVPLPPYIDRPAGPGAQDDARYQTVYAEHAGAVAAPTAGLHVTPELLARLRARPDLSIAPLTLHVGPGTFLPIRVDALDEHVMHSERYCIPAETAALCTSGRPVVALGTTVVRALEAAHQAGGLARAADSFQSTNLFIRPGFRFEVVSHLITNFHLPESTLLMLVCAFAGTARVFSAYETAIEAGYRFYSYGDAMYLSRERA